ncbi:lysophospholipid acyltransferase family protein [Dyadobacter aurulentus]|uniref:lysophospholipid acyltransferase family protein n=1 Tax=Dyadobacter sp. UC 10 TaxID=2605428 RepID=UPI0011F30311|nr:lysophospholipid acyltransferase family protein [Dyadobacter sp. UC 10]KAA0991745.1 lipid A biosynthesis acyltransferase [Dyadobacter sp. UC 10]
MKTLTTRLLLLLLTAISRLSWKNLYRLSDTFRYLIFNVGKYRKAVIVANLRNSFPSYSDDRIRQIASDYYQNFTDIIFETIKMITSPKSDLLERFDLEMDLLNYYYEQKQNLVIMAGHLGNWEMLNLVASAKLSYQIIVVYHELANDTFDDWFRGFRTRFGTEMVPMKNAISKALEPRDKPFLFVLINDQSPVPDKAYWTHFLHQDTGFFRGGELIARRLNAPVLYMGIFKDRIRRGFYRAYFRLITENPRLEPTNAILQSQIEQLEADIMAQPDNWLWSHRRWKHRRPADRRPPNLFPNQQRQTTRSE